jgi:hypothetical protein
MNARRPQISSGRSVRCGPRPRLGREQGQATEGNEPRREIVFLSKSYPCTAWDQLKILILQDGEGPDAGGCLPDEL